MDISAKKEFRSSGPGFPGEMKMPETLGHILIVEPHIEIRHPLARMLRQAGYHVETARDGWSALEMLRREPSRATVINLLITAVFMPGLTGLALSEEIRNREMAVRVLFITGHLDSRLRRVLAERGDHHVLNKPFSSEELLDSVQTLIGGTQVLENEDSQPGRQCARYPSGRFGGGSR